MADLRVFFVRVGGREADFGGGSLFSFTFFTLLFRGIPNEANRWRKKAVITSFIGFIHDADLRLSAKFLRSSFFCSFLAKR
ncbi:hypothetical protein LF95_23425, partial [Thalassospira sp. TSL5-1]